MKCRPADRPNDLNMCVNCHNPKADRWCGMSGPLVRAASVLATRRPESSGNSDGCGADDRADRSGSPSAGNRVAARAARSPSRDSERRCRQLTRGERYPRSGAVWSRGLTPYIDAVPGHWWKMQESNLQPSDPKSEALPIELISKWWLSASGLLGTHRAMGA